MANFTEEISLPSKVSISFTYLTVTMKVNKIYLKIMFR